MNLKQLNSIGSGAYFPIELTTIMGEDGKPEKVTLPDGTQVNKVSWRVISGDVRLINQNIKAILTFQLGQRFRQENFGSRTWECIEEPNTQAQAFLINTFLKEAISLYEDRINYKESIISRIGNKLQ